MQLKSAFYYFKQHSTLLPGFQAEGSRRHQHYHGSEPMSLFVHYSWMTSWDPGTYVAMMIGQLWQTIRIGLMVSETHSY